MTHPIVNLSDLKMTETAPGKQRFAGHAGRIGGVIGMKQLGAQYMIVPPGKTAYPCHNHHVNEEFFVILSGHGTWRVGADRFPVRAGDVIAAPAGGIETAHQLIAGDEKLRYLAISTRHPADIVEYPDSGKKAVAAGIPDGGGMLSARLRRILRPGADLDYWDGEEEPQTGQPG